MEDRRLIADLRDRGIQLAVKGDSLLCSDPRGQLTPELRALIKSRKSSLVQLLSKEREERKPPEAAIPRVEEREWYPVSSQQRRLYALQQLDPSSVAYNISAAYALGRNVDAARLRAAAGALVAAHESLRTSFAVVGGRVAQRVHEVVTIDIEETEIDTSLEAAIEAFARPFDLGQAPLLRIGILRKADGESILLTDAHHIISDGISNVALIKHFAAIYNDSDAGAPSLRYRDYAVWQQEGAGRTALARQRTYWIEQYKSLPSPLALPADFRRPRFRDSAGAAIERVFDTETTAAIGAYCKEREATLFMFLLACYSIALSKRGGQADVVVGAVVSGRDMPGSGDAIGMFANTVPIRAQPAGGKTFDSYLAEVKRLCFGAFENQQYPFEELIDELDLERDTSRNPLFDAALAVQNFDQLSDLAGLGEMKPIPLRRRASKFDLTLSAIQENDRLSLEIEYASSLFRESTIERFADALEATIRAVLSRPSLSISEIPAMGERERARIMDTFNAPLPQPAAADAEPLNSAFEAAAARFPDAIAVSLGAARLTYSELNARANRLARRLREERGVRRHDIVALLAEPSLEMLVGIWGILKAGAAYLPIDPAYPAERIRFMLQDSGCRVAAAQARLLAPSALEGVALIDLEDDAAFASHSPENPRYEQGASDLAYVIYTSGSTGQPKGVLIERRNVARLFSACQPWFGFGHEDVWTLFHYFGFDFSVWEIFGAHLYGGRLVVVPREVARSPQAFYQLLIDEKVTSLSQTPSAFSLLVAEDRRRAEPPEALSLRHIVFGGEALNFESLRPWFKRHGDASPHLTNMYGITETTVHVTYKRIRAEDLDSGRGSDVGAPIPDLQVYLLDEARALAPIGSPGEIYVGGRGVARGYLNRAELDAQRFVPSPFEPGERLYRSGDLGRWLPDGGIEYLGRIDHQVKVRGHRVELGEIEAKLLEIDGVRGAVALAKAVAGEEALLAYYASDRAIGDDELRAALRRSLPAYMMPSRFVRLDEIPLSANGKADRSRLPTPERAVAASERRAPPRDDTERALVEIWEGALGVGNIGIEHDFFELGGHSIKAIQLLGAINDRFGSDLQMGDLYRAPTIAEIADLLAREKDASQRASALESGHAAIARFKQSVIAGSQADLPEGYEDIYPITPIELGMIYSSELAPDQPIYYDQFVYHFHCSDMARLERALALLVRRHDILRTRYYTKSLSEPAKVVMRALERLPLAIEDITELPRDEQIQRIAKHQEKLAGERFQFDGDILWSMRCFQVEAARYVGVLSFHHALLDGWSVASLNRELVRMLSLPGAQELDESPPLKSSYKDYCAIQIGKGESPDTARFWKEKLGGCARNKLPFNYSGKRKRDGVGMESVRRAPAPDLLARLQSLAASRKASLKSVFLAAHAYLLRVANGESEIVAGVVSHDRPALADAEKILGCFLGTMPARLSVREGQTPAELVSEAHRELVEMRPRELHLTEIARAVGINSGATNPFFDCLLNYTDFAAGEKANAGEALRSESEDWSRGALRNAEMTNTLFDLEIDKTFDELSARIKYSPAYFDREDMEYALELYLRILERFADASDEPLRPDALVSAEERRFLVHEFNDTVAPFSERAALHQLFEASAARAPEAVALRAGGETMTYGRLNERANRLARCILESGAAPGDSVGLVAERHFDMVVGMLGILKAGCAYVPIDPEYPAERQSYIIENSSASLVVLSGERATDAAAESAGARSLRIDDAQLARFDSGNINMAVDARQLAYTIYTSGSTGAPKGAMLEHRSAVNLVEWVNRTFGVGPSDRLLFVSSMCFDLSVYDVFGILAAGGSATIVTLDQLRDFAELKRALTEDGITFWNSVPTTMDYLVRELEREGAEFIQSKLRLVFLSGDWIPVSLPERLGRYFPNARAISLGGATEAAVWSNVFEIGRVDPSWSSIPYGAPIANNFFYIVDEQLRLVPPGAVGELCIGGLGVAAGYANDEERTAAAFAADPFRAELGGRMYRTGDLGRMTRAGYMEFLGRKDHQVKVRGYRVELGEIESRLSKLRGVEAAVVDARKDASGANFLVAYIVGDMPEDTAALRDYLGSKLPFYMVPSRYIKLGALPLTPNGKVDRKALPDPDMALAAASSYVAPRTETERALARIWAETLGLERVGIEDDFFDLGGDSLIMIRIAAKARKAGMTLVVRDIFEAPTIAGLAKRDLYKAAEQEADSPTGPLQLSPMQSFFFSGPIPERYYIPINFDLLRRVSFIQLRAAIAELLRHHDGMRAQFRATAEGWSASIPEFDESLVDDVVAARDLSQLSFAEQDKVTGWAWARLDFENGRNLICTLYERGSDRPQLAQIFVHHLVADGERMRIVTEDLARLLQQTLSGQPLKLPGKTAPIRSVMQTIAAACRSAELREEMAYWDGLRWAEERRIPFDFDVPLSSNTFASTCQLAAALDRESTGALLRGLPEAGATMFEAILLALSSSLCELTGGRLAQVSAGSAGGLLSRFAPGLDVSRTVGWFNAGRRYALPKPESTEPLDRLREIAAAARATPNQGLGFEMLMYHSGDREVSERLRKVSNRDIYFNYLGPVEDSGGSDGVAELKGFSASERFQDQSYVSQRDLIFFIEFKIERGQLAIACDYSRNLHRESTIRGFLSSMRDELAALAESCRSADSRELAL